VTNLLTIFIKRNYLVEGMDETLCQLQNTASSTFTSCLYCLY